jgi:hypothetical protein
MKFEIIEINHIKQNVTGLFFKNQEVISLTINSQSRLAYEKKFKATCLAVGELRQTEKSFCSGISSQYMS